ncbi:uncharacterized protein BO72DRAFT_452794 [Aspergillus fijiensis CBS 313.89]|uniref:Uncharacterized protein n=1 Tax=Aspergillus fijiensis CBS 313.89 TaxID=1448319 RepID=A0A8G1VTS0_9EURO|nr:uncharacterized protein BO72DRAFT_452794 [Aspergillus fijiensis CBS 313.89]RAK72377.1 hypothetical protein BO72DRAFT_452794 [Aspergillus fijiensis CBS 313.89]
MEEGSFNEGEAFCSSFVLAIAFKGRKESVCLVRRIRQALSDMEERREGKKRREEKEASEWEEEEEKKERLG